MRIGFIVHRKPFLKVLGPLITKSFDEGHEVTILYTLGSKDTEKSYQNVDAEYLAGVFGDGCEYAPFDADNLSNKALEARLNALFTLEGYYHATSQGYLNELDLLKQEGVKLISLSHFFEFILRPIEALDFFDQSIYLSEYQADLHFKLLGDESGKLQRNYESKYSVLGSPMFDLIALQDRESARSKFNIPHERKVVLLMSPVLTLATPWRYRIWREPSKFSRSIQSLKAKQLQDLPEIWFGKTFKDSVNAIRFFCDREDALLVVKSRGKHDDPDYLIEAADVFIDGMDDDFFPSFTSYELLSLADLCITVMSMTALEAVAAKVPTINIYVPHLDFELTISEEYLQYVDLLMHGDPDSLMNTAGCVNMVSYKKISDWMLNHCIASVPWDEQISEDYSHYFLGIGDQSSSDRIMSFLGDAFEAKKQ